MCKINYFTNLLFKSWGGGRSPLREIDLIPNITVSPKKVFLVQFLCFGVRLLSYLATDDYITHLGEKPLNYPGSD